MPRSAVMRRAGTRARSPAVSMPRRCCAIDSAYGDRPAAASGVAGGCLGRRLRALGAGGLGRVGGLVVLFRLRRRWWTAVVSGGTVSRSRKMSVQARVISCSVPNRLAGVAVQRDREELHQAVAGHRVEEVLGELHLLVRVEEPGVGQVVAPGRQLAAGHLVQRDGHRVQLGGLVVALP